MFILLSTLTLILLFALSAFWSLTETALTSLSKYRIKKIIALNKPLSGALKEWLKSPYYILTTILISDTVTNLTISVLSIIVALSIFYYVPREVVEICTWIIVTFLALVLGEITPKIFGRSNPEKITLICLPALSRMVKIIRPVTLPLLKFAGLLFPKTDLLPVSRLTYLSVEEIKGLISEAGTSGMLGKETSQMLQRVLRLGEQDVRQIMTPSEKVDAVNLDQAQEKFLDLVVETGRSRVPVYHASLSRIAGYVYVKDLLVSWRKHNGAFSANIIRPAYFVRHDRKVHDLLKDFQSGQTHMAFVLDAFNNFIGVVTLEDVLEEIVGEILDEYDIKHKPGSKK